MKVSIYIPSLRRDDSYERARASIEKHTTVPYRITDAAVGSRSCAKNHNAGLMVCMDSEYIAQVNSDCEVTDGWLEKMLETMQLSPDIALVGPKVVMFDGTIFSCGTAPNLRNYHAGEVDSGQREFVEEVIAVPCNCYLYRRRVLWDLGDGFDTRFIKAGAFMDTDFCMRLRSLGHRIFYDGRVKVIHHKPQKQGRWHSWNHIYFHAKHPSTILRQWL